MKRVLLLVFIIVSAFLWGQNGPKYYLNLKNISIAARASDRICGSTARVIIHYKDPSLPAETVFEHYRSGGTFYSTPVPDKINIPIKGDISWIESYHQVVDAQDELFSTCCNCRYISTYEQSKKHVPNNCVSIAGNINGSSGDGQARGTFNYNYQLLPNHSLQSDVVSNQNGLIIYNTYLPSDDKINLNAKPGFDAELYHYQYSLDNINWLNIESSLFVLEKLSLSAKDILGANYIQYLGQNIYFRVASCLSNGIYQSVSSPVVLTITQSSPHISSSSVTPAKCFDTTDGTATINFDRKLLPGETLRIPVKNADTGGAVDIGIPGYEITSYLQNSTTYTINNLAPGKYKLDLLGTYNGNSTYTDSPTHTINFEITKPTAVIFDMTSKTDVYCFQGSDGNIALTASGGQNQYQYKVVKNGQPFLDWTNFSNANNALIQNLSAGVYKIKVRDSNQCVAKDPNNSSNEKEITVTITQPAKAIELSEIYIARPKGYGLSDGYISLRVTGGTPKTDGSYDFEWRKDTPTGTVIPQTQSIVDATNNPFTIKLNNIQAGKYYLTVKDKNYVSATSQLGNCGIITQEFIVTQPEPLVASIEVQKQISCNIANDYPFKLDFDNNGIADEAEDGSLKAVVTGGVGTYTYKWQILNNGAFQDIPGAVGQTLSNRSIGTYKVLVSDLNVNTTNASYTFAFPSELVVSTSANTISCNNQNSGIVSANATGGTGALSYQWSSGATTPTVTGLPAANYFLIVSDTKNCKVKKTAQIIQPDQIIITDILVKNPICFGASNGEIKTTISGGKAPYSISWSNGATTADNMGIPAGTYTMTVTDANGCSSTKQYTLANPVQLTIDLGADITLCSGDTKTYNVAISDVGATYQWKDQNGSVIGTSAIITLSAAGTYSVVITDSKGCTAMDSVKIKNSSEVLNPQFMLATHAYVEASVVLVNTSPTQPQSVEWVIPTNNNIQVIQKTNSLLELKFSTTGSYEIGLKGIQGECAKTFYKKVIVEENTSGATLNPTKASNVTEFTILPNPNNGVFKVLVKLGKEKPIKIRIVDMVSHEVFPAVSQSKATYFAVPFNTTLPSGTYLVILETGDEAMVKRIIVQ